MKTNKFGELILNEDDLCNAVMQGHDISKMSNVVLDHSVDLEHAIQLVEDPSLMLTWTFPENDNVSVPEFDKVQQEHWHLPEEYRELDIAKYILDLCTTTEQLQRVGHELLMFQEHNLFDLLRYMKYLVDVMRENNVIWGVGRGSSVASYILYLLGVHRIDSMFYDLDPGEFLR